MNAAIPCKTPISLLQEVCSQNNLTPEYKLMSVEGVVHAPTFVFRVQINENCSATGTGQSKKKAKHSAAKTILEQLLQKGGTFENEEKLEELRSLVEHDIPVIETTEGPKEEEGNPVGTLQEMCMKRRWRPPYYEMILQHGPPHERTFELECSVNDFKELGSGKSKRLAKRQAAQLMIEKLEKECPMEETEKKDKKEEFNGFVLREDWPEGLPTMCKLLPNSSHQMSVSKFVREIRANCGIILNSLHTIGLGDKGKERIELLDELAQEQNFTVKYISLGYDEVDEKFHYLVQLSSVPVVLCFGSGIKEADAKAEAAYSTLKYLKVISKMDQTSSDLDDSFDGI